MGPAREAHKRPARRSQSAGMRRTLSLKGCESRILLGLAQEPDGPSLLKGQLDGRVRHGPLRRP